MVRNTKEDYGPWRRWVKDYDLNGDASDLGFYIDSIRNKDAETALVSLKSGLKKEGFVIKKKRERRIWKRAPKFVQRIFDEWARRPTNLPGKGVILVPHDFDERSARGQIRTLVHEAIHDDIEEELGLRPYSGNWLTESGRWAIEMICFSSELIAMASMSGVKGGYTAEEVDSKLKRIAANFSDNYRIKGVSQEWIERISIEAMEHKLKQWREHA